ncbi:hypothetical protein IQ07DRAFT_570909 [Pyrenochaeta sp. DS3sAY3a]|nr:hypothetical protein IQ07DRAFT_570909 [Pyrenochaeta sp. DS3sAY3a]
MATYVDAECQTIWAGLTKRASVRPEMLLTAPDTTTPPDEMVTEKPQFLAQIPSIVQPPPDDAPAKPQTLLERRKNRPGLVARISLPETTLVDDGIDDEVLPSPPPTQAAISPLPEANKRHAGHTPLFPRSRSRSPSPVQGQAENTSEVQPAAPEEDRVQTPSHDEALTGPLVLPTNPVDGTADHIALDALDIELEKVARDQERFSRLKDAPEPAIEEVTEQELPLSRKGSAESRRSADDVDFIDGVQLKSPPLNFGAPLGQVSRRRSEADDPY